MPAHSAQAVVNGKKLETTLMVQNTGELLKYGTSIKNTMTAIKIILKRLGKDFKKHTV